MKKKLCGRCGQSKPLDMFSKQKDTKDGLRPWCRPCFAVYNKDWRSRNKARHNNLIRVSKLKRRGVTITLDELHGLHDAQKDRCAICGNPETLVRCNTKAVLSVDHCHASGKVRGLLCRRCNTGIANFDEDVDRIKAAIEYLKKHQ